MSFKSEDEPYWMISTNGYVLIYNITYSMNPNYEEDTVWEYGIECSLYDSFDALISSAHVSHISPDRDFVLSMVQILTRTEVFPVHLVDIVSDLLVTMNETVSDTREAHAYV